MRSIVTWCALQVLRASLIGLVLSMAVLVLGAAVFAWVEGWNWFDAFYFAVVAATTIG